MKIGRLKVYLSKFILLTFLGVFLLPVSFASAATLTLQSSSNKVDVGNLFTVKVYINSQNIFINNAEATVNFPNDLIEVVSVDSKSSLFTMWVEPPTFSNVNGIISFNGGITNPGYKGSGQLVSILFKAKSPGVASLFFSSPAVKASDGLGTDVLSGQNSIDVTIAAVNQAAPEPAPPAEQPKKSTETNTAISNVNNIVVSSPTHPDQNSWYSLNDATLVWKNPDDTKKLQVTLSADQNTTPSKDLPVDTTTRTVTDVSDGVSYFIIRYKGADGWSEPTAYKLMIDSAAPHSVKFDSQPQDDGSTVFTLSALDATSGIKNFKISFDGDAPVLVSGPEYKQVLTPGKHTVSLTALDGAGNNAVYTADVLARASAAPTITDYTQSAKFNETANATGETVYANANLSVTVKSAYGLITEYGVKSDEHGKFKFESEPLRTSGGYELWAAVVNPDGTKGPASPIFKFTVGEKSSITKQILAVVFSPLMLLILLILALLALAGIGWYKFFIVRLQYRQLLKELEQLKAESAEIDVEEKPIKKNPPVVKKKITKAKVGKPPLPPAIS